MSIALMAMAAAVWLTMFVVGAQVLLVSALVSAAIIGKLAKPVRDAFLTSVRQRQINSPRLTRLEA